MAEQERNEMIDKVYNTEHEKSSDWEDRIKRPLHMSDFEQA